MEEKISTILKRNNRYVISFGDNGVKFIQHNHEPMRQQNVSPEEFIKYKENDNVFPFLLHKQKEHLH